MSEHYLESEPTRPILRPGMKLADLVESDVRLLPILSRLGIPLGFGEVSVEEMCRRHRLSADLFLTICRIYASDHPAAVGHTLTTDVLPDLIAYLRTSHDYYQQALLPRLESKMERLIEGFEGVHRKILGGFFASYCREVDNHFAYEEQTVFPYVRALIDGESVKGYRIACFEDNHSDIDGKLSDLKSIIIKYLPETAPSDLCDELLFDLFRLEEDLLRHTVIEECVLVPLVEKLERDGHE